VRRGVRDAEADRHPVEELARAEVVADREDELVLAGGELVREPGAAVRVGDRRDDELAAAGSQLAGRPRVVSST
jgi:hypothetical protein